MSLPMLVFSTQLAVAAPTIPEAASQMDAASHAICHTHGRERRDAVLALEAALTAMEAEAAMASDNADAHTLEVLSTALSDAWRRAHDTNLGGPCRAQLAGLAAMNTHVSLLIPDAKKWSATLDDPNASLEELQTLSQGNPPHGVMVDLSRRIQAIGREVDAARRLVATAQSSTNGLTAEQACQDIAAMPSVRAEVLSELAKAEQPCKKLRSESAILERNAWQTFSAESFPTQWQELSPIARSSPWTNHRVGARLQMIDLLSQLKRCPERPMEPASLGPGDVGAVRVWLPAERDEEEIIGFVPPGGAVRVIRQCLDSPSATVPQTDWLIDHEGRLGIATAMAAPAASTVRTWLLDEVEDNLEHCTEDGGVFDAEVTDTRGSVVLNMDYWPEVDLREEARSAVAWGLAPSAQAFLDRRLLSTSICVALVMQRGLRADAIEPPTPAPVPDLPSGWSLVDFPYSADQFSKLIAVAAAPPTRVEIRVRLLREIWSKDAFGNDVQTGDATDRTSSLVLGSMRFQRNNWPGIAEILDDTTGWSGKHSEFRKYTDGWSTW